MPDLNYGWIIAGASLIWGIVSFAWMRRLERANVGKAEIDNINAKLGAIDKRVAAVEKSIEVLPTRESVHKIEIALEAIKGDVDVVAESIKPLAHATARIENFLLTGKRAS